jgi:hypothetical protein
MPLFLHRTPFQNMTTIKRLMWKKNQDIRRLLLMLTIVVLIRVWILFFILILIIFIFQTFLNVIQRSLTFEGRCSFFQRINGPEMWNPQILLFPYDRSESFPYYSFKRWIPTPPNSPLMTDEEKKEATIRRVREPPFCKCGYRSQLVNPPNGLDYTLFWHCHIPLSVKLHKITSLFVINLFSWCKSQ